MTSTTQTRTSAGRARALVAASVFLLAYLLVGPLAGSLADRDLPMPDAAASTIAAFYAANPAAALVGAILQLVSVLGLLVFAHTIGADRRTVLLGRLAVGAMVVSCLLTAAVTVLAGELADDTVAMLRLAGFYAGGVVHVVLLGSFTLSAATLRTRAVRRFGYVAGSLAVLSVLSVVVYYANALLPVGRVLCMLWAVTAAVSAWRRLRT